MTSILFYRLVLTPIFSLPRLRCPLRWSASTPSTSFLLLFLFVFICSPVCVRGISYRKRVFGVLFGDGSEQWELNNDEYNSSLPKQLCGGFDDKFQGTIKNSSVHLNYTCVAVFAAMRSSALCISSTLITMVDAHVVNNNIIKTLDLLDNHVDVIITKGLERAPQRMLVYKWLHEILGYYNSFESVLVIDHHLLAEQQQQLNSSYSHSSLSRPANITALSGLIPHLRVVYKGGGARGREKNKTEKGVGTTFDKGMFMSAVKIRSFQNPTSFSSNGDDMSLVPVMWPVSVQVSVQPLSSLQMTPLTARSICNHRRAQGDIVSNVVSVLNEVHTIDQSTWRQQSSSRQRTRREASDPGENPAEGEESKEGRSSCPDMEGRVAIPLSFIVLFLIVLTLINICIFSYALSKAAGAGGEEPEEEEDDEEKRKKETAPKEVKEDQIVISRNNNLKSAPPPEDKDARPAVASAKESTPLLRHKKNKSGDSNTPAPLYKTDSTEFWEIEADHGYNEF